MRKKPEIVENGQNGGKNKSSRDWFYKKESYLEAGDL